MGRSGEIDVSMQLDAQATMWARSILPAPAIASRQWSHALARRCREPARVAGFIEPASNLHHIVMATTVGFHFEVRELGTSNWRHYDVGPGELCVVGAGGAPSELCWRSQGRGRFLEVVELYIDPVGLRSKGGQLAPAFLQERGAGSNGSSFLGLWSLDTRSGKYRAHYFLAPSGDVVVLTHEWSEHGQSFVGSADLGGGVHMQAEDRFLDRDTYEWSITIQDGAGKVLTRMHARERRVGA